MPRRLPLCGALLHVSSLPCTLDTGMLTTAFWAVGLLLALGVDLCPQKTALVSPNLRPKAPKTTSGILRALSKPCQFLPPATPDRGPLPIPEGS